MRATNNLRSSGLLASSVSNVSRSLCRRVYRYVTPRQIERVDSFLRWPAWFLHDLRLWLIIIYRYWYGDKIVRRDAKCWRRILFDYMFIDYYYYYWSYCIRAFNFRANSIAVGRNIKKRRIISYPKNEMFDNLFLLHDLLSIIDFNSANFFLFFQHTFVYIRRIDDIICLCHPEKFTYTFINEWRIRLYIVFYVRKKNLENG